MHRARHARSGNVARRRAGDERARRSRVPGAGGRVARLLACLLLAAGCAREPGEAPRAARPDSLASAVEPAPALTLPAGELPAGAPAPPPEVIAVAPRREALAPPLPEAPPAEPPAAAEPPPLEIDDALKPPIPRGEVAVHWPDRTPARAVVELDVRVDETGEPSDAVWAAGDTATARTAPSLPDPARSLPPEDGPRCPARSGRPQCGSPGSDRSPHR